VVVTNVESPLPHPSKLPVQVMVEIGSETPRDPQANQKDYAESLFARRGMHTAKVKFRPFLFVGWRNGDEAAQKAAVKQNAEARTNRMIAAIILIAIEMR